MLAILVVYSAAYVLATATVLVLALMLIRHGELQHRMMMRRMMVQSVPIVFIVVPAPAAPKQ